jgi:8-oxo-dGTP pyrophosphatase MutT (NUDIX family)
LHDTASRELSEETGLVAGKLEVIGQTCNEPGLVQLRTTIFVATDLVKGNRDIEHTEIGMKLKFFTIEQVEEMIERGKIQCGFALSAWTFFRNYLQSHELT